MFIHLVYFWLKPDNKDAARERIVKDCDAILKRIPAVRHLWCGRPVPSDRPVVDGSYDIGLCVVYDDKAGHDAYQSHALHQEFLARNKGSFDTIRVYDFS